MKKFIFKEIFTPSIVITLFVAILCVVAEPVISLGAEDQFTISQNVTAEVSFATPASDITMSPAIGGLTGGTANGGTQVVVLTNNDTGYTMTITASSSLGMIGVASSTNYIPALVAAGAVPLYDFNTSTIGANKAYFGYTVEASTTADVAQAFKNNGSACNIGANNGSDHCWLNASTTAFTVISRNYYTPASGATTTLKFKVVVNANPSPMIPDDTYVATTTLTATLQ